VKNNEIKGHVSLNLIDAAGKAVTAQRAETTSDHPKHSSIVFRPSSLPVL